jgi:cation diffusion facilitator family transporter
MFLQNISHLTKEFPYGLYKVENLVSFISAGLIFFSGYEIARRVFLSGGTQVKLHGLAVAVTGLAVILLVVYLFARYELRKGYDLNSPALKADSSHLKTDIASTLVVVAGLIGSACGYQFVDRVAAFVVVLFIARAGWHILVEAMRNLLDASVNYTTLENIKRVVIADPRVKEIKSVVARNSGSVIFINMELVCLLQTLEEASEVSKELAAAVRTTVPYVERVQISMDPVEKDYLLVAVPLADNKDAISEHFGKAPFLAIVKLSRDTWTQTSQEILTNPYANEDKAKGIHLSRYLSQKGVDIIYCREPLEGKGPVYILESAGVRLETTDSKSLVDLITMLSERRA